MLYVLPSWFILSSVILEAIFSIATLSVALYSLKIYLISKQKETKLFSMGFFLISLSYIMWLILNLSALIEINETREVLEITNAWSMITMGAYLHIVLFILGLVILVYSISKIERLSILALIMALSVVPVIRNNYTSEAFYATSSILILFILIYYLKESKVRKNRHLLLMAVSFAFLLISTIELMFTSLNYLNYVLAHILMLISYLLILINLGLSLKHGKKKK